MKITKYKSKTYRKTMFNRWGIRIDREITTIDGPILIESKLGNVLIYDPSIELYKRLSPSFRVFGKCVYLFKHFHQEWTERHYEGAVKPLPFKDHPIGSVEFRSRRKV